ncbi:MAG: hypothetical protein F6K31_09605 [Symploca sp. SIO2G7]|nr:hypothetical protein [Symploca sp. SIO2G7]
MLTFTELWEKLVSHDETVEIVEFRAYTGKMPVPQEIFCIQNQPQIGSRRSR